MQQLSCVFINPSTLGTSLDARIWQAPLHFDEVTMVNLFELPQLRQPLGALLLVNVLLPWSAGQNFACASHLVALGSRLHITTAEIDANIHPAPCLCHDDGAALHMRR